SLIGTFAIMYLLGYSLDNLSLMALTLCVGFVVDDAIVMLENITRHMEAGDPPFEASLKGSREIGFTIISMTLSLAAVFILVLFVKIPKGFFPSEDIGQIFAITEGAQGISFNSMYEHQAAVNRVISADTNVLNFTSSIGAGGSTVAANGGRIFIRLKPRSERRLHVDQILQKLRAKLAAIPGIKVYLQNPPAIRIGGMLTRSLYQYTLQSTDTRELYHWASIIEAKMARLPGFQDVSSDLLIRTPQVNVEIDRDRARALSVTAEQIESALYDAYGSRQISTIYTPANEYWVVMELEPKFQQDVEALSQLYVRSSSGK